MDNTVIYEVLGDATGTFVCADGVRIAKRDPQTAMWTSEPGWVVKSVQCAWDHCEIVIERDRVRVH
jgi:hypothetical protein